MTPVGFLGQDIYIFRYLKFYQNIKLGFYIKCPVINENHFRDCYWTGVSQDSGEVTLGNNPSTRVNCMMIHFFVDENHAGDTNIIWYQTGLLLLCNRELII